MGIENLKISSRLVILPALTSFPNLVSGYHSSSPARLLNPVLGGLGPP